MPRRAHRTQKKFRGGREQLDAVLVLAGRDGFWELMPAGYWRFNDTGGAILNWWESTGTLDFQGPQAARVEFEEAVVKTALAGLGGRPQLPPQGSG